MEIAMSKGLGDLFNDPDFRRRLRQRIQEGWTFEKIEPMSTAEIFARLNRLGIPVTPEDFQQAAQRHESAERLADEWYKRYTLHPEGRYDEDFVWMAAIVLWKRLVPDRTCFEQINERIREGYDLLERRRTAEACDAWWQVWEWLVEKVTPERNTIAALDADFVGTQSVYNWCQDFEMELGNACIDDARYCRLRIRYCQEFLEAFSGIGWLMRGNFLRAEAESYWRLGDVETAEARFEALIEANPNWAWGYIDWSDLYWLYQDSPKDYARGEAILRRALARPRLEDREDVLDRLEKLRAERAPARAASRREKRRQARGSKRPPRRRKRQGR
jgi:tetratricopeptide (TPR) repeat protein